MAGVRSIIALAFGTTFGITFLVLACVIPKPVYCYPLINLVFYFLSPFPFLFARRINDDFDSPNGALEVNKAVYTATEVACGWAGAVTQKPPVNAEKS